MLWLRPDGAEFSDAEWNDPARAAMAMLLDRRSIVEPDARGDTIAGDSLLAIFNGAPSPTAFVMPGAPGGGAWTRLADTADPSGPALTAPAGTTIEARGRSVSIWSRKA